MRTAQDKIHKTSWEEESDKKKTFEAEKEEKARGRLYGSDQKMGKKEKVMPYVKTGEPTA